jgi:hypothetical protein
MSTIVDHPFLILLVAVATQWCAAYGGDLLRRKVWPVDGEQREDFNTVLSATLTLLALIIGFTFAMAVSRYDLRKAYEEAEANAIGTAYLRADLLPGDEAARLRRLLDGYLNQRIAFYEERGSQSAALAANRMQLEADLWSTAARGASTEGNAVVALTVSGVNDVLNSQGFTQAAWLNRIPPAAWELMALIALFANALLGYREHKTGLFSLLVLPVIISVAFFLIADIDSPKNGVIRVAPQNLVLLAQSLRSAPEEP